MVELSPLTSSLNKYAIKKKSLVFLLLKIKTFFFFEMYVE